MSNTYGIKSASGSLQSLTFSKYGGTEYTALTASNSGVTANVHTLTASFAKITTLDVDTINSNTVTQNNLEVQDKLIIAAVSASYANSSGGGLQIGGHDTSGSAASVLWDNGNAALDFSVKGTTQVRLQDGAFLPETDSDVDLGTSTRLFKNLYVDAFGANWTNAGRTVADLGTVTTVDLNGGSIDGTVIGANSEAAGAKAFNSIKFCCCYSCFVDFC